MKIESENVDSIVEGKICKVDVTSLITFSNYKLTTPKAGHVTILLSIRFSRGFLDNIYERFLMTEKIMLMY